MRPPISSELDEHAVREWIDRCLAGDLAAFRLLMESYQRYAYALSFRLLRDEEQTRDVVQEAFIRVWKNLHSYRPVGKFSTWLYKIVVHLCYDRMKMESRRNIVSGLLGWGSGGNDIAADIDLHDCVEKADLCASILAAAGDLPPMERLVFHLRDVQDFSIGEIAEVAGISTGSVKTNLCYARRRIRNTIDRIEQRGKQ